MLNIDIKIQGADILLKRLQGFPKLQERALVNALNVLGRAAAKEAKKGITQEYNITSRDLGEGIGIIPARGGASGKQKLFTVITAKGKRIPLYDFGALPKLPASQKGIPISVRRPVTVKLLKKGRRHPVYRSTSAGSAGRMPFLARMTQGFGGSVVNHVGIFVRMDKLLRNRTRTKGKLGGRRGLHQVIREVRAEGIPAMFLKIGGEAMRQLTINNGAEILAQKINDQIIKRNL